MCGLRWQGSRDSYPVVSRSLKLNVAIQSHPRRAEMAAGLADFLGGEVVFDPEPDDFPSPWRCYRRALELTPPHATHRMILQEDVRVCNYFLETLGRALTAQPDRLLVLFVGGYPAEHAMALRAASDRGEHWVELTNATWCPAVALCWPTRLVAPFLAWADEQDLQPKFRADDEIIGRFLRDAGEWPLATVPSLVEHPDDVPSLIGMRAAGGADPARVAACFVPEDCDPRTVDWSLGPG